MMIGKVSQEDKIPTKYQESAFGNGWMGASRVNCKILLSFMLSFELVNDMQIAFNLSLV